MIGLLSSILDCLEAALLLGFPKAERSVEMVEAWPSVLIVDAIDEGVILEAVDLRDLILEALEFLLFEATLDILFLLADLYLLGELLKAEGEADQVPVTRDGSGFIAPLDCATPRLLRVALLWNLDGGLQ